MAGKRIIIKVGTNLISKTDGTLDEEIMNLITGEICSVKSQGNDIVLVSSGAVGAGSNKLKFASRPKVLIEKQAAAAVGQVLLMEAYEELFGNHGVNIAQVLLTRQDLEARERYLNVRNTMNTLLSMGIVPIVNENDTVSVEEIEFGDNDTLSAIIAAKLEASHLVILTDVDGLYMGNPRVDKECALVSRIEKITPDIEKYVCGKPGSVYSIGGMAAKLKAAKIASSAGVTVFIANGRRNNVIRDIADGKEVGSCFVPSAKSIGARKRWIAFGARIKGKIFVDQGACDALVEKGRSLLPSGITSVEGSFETGDIISVCSPEKKEIARGIVSFNSEEVKRIKGKKSHQIKEILNKEGVQEVIHRNNLVITKERC